MIREQPRIQAACPTNQIPPSPSPRPVPTSSIPVWVSYWRYSICAFCLGHIHKPPPPSNVWASEHHTQPCLHPFALCTTKPSGRAHAFLLIMIVELRMDRKRSIFNGDQRKQLTQILQGRASLRAWTEGYASMPHSMRRSHSAVLRQGPSSLR